MEAVGAEELVGPGLVERSAVLADEGVTATARVGLSGERARRAPAHVDSGSVDVDRASRVVAAGAELPGPCLGSRRGVLADEGIPGAQGDLTRQGAIGEPGHVNPGGVRADT